MVSKLNPPIFYLCLAMQTRISFFFLTRAKPFLLNSYPTAVALYLFSLPLDSNPGPQE